MLCERADAAARAIGYIIHRKAGRPFRVDIEDLLNHGRNPILPVLPPALADVFDCKAMLVTDADSSGLSSLGSLSEFESKPEKE